jgi:hypothetical protein
MNDYLNQIQGVLNKLINIGVIVVDSELIIQILSTLPNSWEVLTNNLMYRTTMPSFIKSIAMMFQEKLCYEIKETWKVEHNGLIVNHYNKRND